MYILDVVFFLRRLYFMLAAGLCERVIISNTMVSTLPHVKDAASKEIEVMQNDLLHILVHWPTSQMFKDQVSTPCAIPSQCHIFVQPDVSNL